MRLVCVSDTHGRTADLRVPDGDVLIHAGDLTNHGSLEEIADAASWLKSLPHRHRVVIAGNHDFGFQRTPGEARALLKGLTYLEDSEALVAGLRVYGSPWQPWFFDWAFNLERGAEIRAKWDRIPPGLDVLVTHGPPLGILDSNVQGLAVGCADLLAAVKRTRPRLHVFGHIHEAYGRAEQDGTTFVNACTCDLRYRPVHPPVVVDLDPTQV